jgi:hypothetical protein
MHGEGEEAKIGIVVALSLVAERATIEHEPRGSERVEGKVTRQGLAPPLSPFIFFSMKANHRLEGVSCVCACVPVKVFVTCTLRFILGAVFQRPRIC